MLKYLKLTRCHVCHATWFAGRFRVFDPPAVILGPDGVVLPEALGKIGVAIANGEAISGIALRPLGPGHFIRGLGEGAFAAISFSPGEILGEYSGLWKTSEEHDTEQARH